MDTIDLLLTSCRHSQSPSITLWDYKTGNILNSYKNGGVVAPKTLNLVSYDYILVSDEDKPLTHIWPLNSQEPIKKLTTILPQKIKVMTVCPNSNFVAAGIGPKLYVWQINSGKLFTIQKKNFQDITCVKFSSDGNFVIIGGEDGMLVVYLLENLVCLYMNEGQCEPLYTKQDHTLPIQDIYVGQFGSKSRCVTVSPDHTCKIYNLNTGNLLLNLVFGEPLTSVIFDGPCWNLYVGRNSGKIQQFLLREPPRTIDHHIQEEIIFQGHEKRINCLDLSPSNDILISGSDDNFVFVWEISSGQILRRIEHKGPITNVKCVLRHENFFSHDLKFTCIVRNFDRDLIQGEEYVTNFVQNFDIDEDDFAKDDGESSNLKRENLRLRAINQQLYEAAMNLSRKYNNF